jgi:hypothetical protein
VRPLLAERGCTVEGGIRLRTLADVVAHLGASGQLSLLEATEVRVPHPAEGRSGRRWFVSGKARATTAQGAGPHRRRGAIAVLRAVPPGRHSGPDRGAPGRPGRAAGPHPGVTLLADAGYQGLSAQTAGAVLTPRPARRKNQFPVRPALAAAHEAERRAQAAQLIRVEHGISHLKNWRALSRHLGRCEHLDAILPAVAWLLSAQEQALRPDRLPRPPRALPAGITA